jgi:hypothetical protein
VSGVFEKVGLGYALTADDAGVEMRIGRLRRSSGELSGELIVRTWITGVRTYGKGGILHQARFNLSSSRARTDLGRTLANRAPGIELDWFGLLEELAQSTLEAEGKGEEIIEVGTLKPDPTRLKYGIEPLCPFRAVTWLYGPGGSGKSAFALAALLSVRMGREILPGMAPTMRGEALYLDWETDPNTVNERVQTICRGLGVEPMAIKYRRCNRPLADDAEQIAAIVARSEVKFLVVDSAAYAMGAQGEYGDANDSTIRLFEALRLIGITTLVVDHVSKAEMRLGGKVRAAMPYGSAYKINGSRSAWELRRLPEMGDGMRIGLVDAKVNDRAYLDPIGVRAVWVDNSLTFLPEDVRADFELMPAGPASVSPELTVAERMIELLSDGGRMRAVDIARTIDANSGTVRVQLNRDKRFVRTTIGDDDAWMISTELVRP